MKKHFHIRKQPTPTSRDGCLSLRQSVLDRTLKKDLQEGKPKKKDVSSVHAGVLPNLIGIRTCLA